MKFSNARFYFFFVLIFFLIAGWEEAASAATPAVAFHYGTKPPLDELRAFDWVIVQPDADVDPLNFATGKTRLFAYVSVGEQDRKEGTEPRLPAPCLAGANPVWHSRIIDHSLPICRQYYLDHIFSPLWERGYRGFFLDTLDSYQLISHNETDRRRHQEGLVMLIEALKRRFPKVHLITNRGFAFLDRIAGHIDAVAAESLYHGWNESLDRYEPVSEKDRAWLLKRLQEARELGLEVIVIDYLPPRERARARRLAKRIRQAGFIPWVSNGDLNMLGVGLREVLPRKVMVLYNDEFNLDYFALPLNYLGYSVRPQQVNRPLPVDPLSGTYAGIVTWFGGPLGREETPVWRWLVTQREQGVPVVFLGDFGFPTDEHHLQPFGLARPDSETTGSMLKVAKADPDFFGYEMKPVVDSLAFFPLHSQSGRVLLRLSDNEGRFQDAAAITPWGGYVLDPNVFHEITLPQAGTYALWILDPFRFFTGALKRPEAPWPDVTTRSGRRVLTVHIDGDGLANRTMVADHAGHFSGEVVEKEILRRYPWPTAVAFIAGELVDGGVYPRLAPQLRQIARRIARIPWIEPATHTYSHPFDWRALEEQWLRRSRGQPVRKEEKGTTHYNLPIPGYRFDPVMETAGSANLLNKLVFPPGKKVRVIAWSGDTDPGVVSLKAAYDAGLLNINGGGSKMMKIRPSLMQVASNGLWKDGYFQVFAPMANENDFTRLWRGPFYGFRRAIDTFELTESPRRLKPINIYYHFYSGEREASLKALREVYRWVSRQRVHPLRTSDYIRSALDFEHLVIAREGNHWVVRQYGESLTLRAPEVLGGVDLRTSRGIAGYHPAANSERYIHLVPGGEARLIFSQDTSPIPYVISSNGTVERYEWVQGDLRVSLRGEVPLKVRWKRANSCSLSGIRPKPMRRQESPGETQYRFAGTAADFTFHCR